MLPIKFASAAEEQKWQKAKADYEDAKIKRKTSNCAKLSPPITAGAMVSFLILHEVIPEIAV